MEIKTELVQELNHLYNKYASQSFQEHILSCLEIIKQYDFDDKQNMIFASYALRFLFVLKAKLEENVDLTTNFGNLLGKGYTTGHQRKKFNFREKRNQDEYEEEIDFYIEHNFFDEEYERLQYLATKYRTKLSGDEFIAKVANSNLQKAYFTVFECLDNQELAVRLQIIAIQLLKITVTDKKPYNLKFESLMQLLTVIEKAREEYLTNYNQIFR
ncbi:hypothetical protein SSYRP_v1c01560 [Spiroplasma syrphidicola EA-1]|uniref:Uncharacterized protein n=1 Tax=Spiroplasma syrphidicola EA-1 TaxID=1276229 RepID=R4U2Z5_9MOLU|nr:hypothetical protein [Spiroplasma syrphidicola]AGM25752.1 hypothetical protein SSYRP_v1c01560 [Spiroplasma syrphidicola EA-1]